MDCFISNFFQNNPDDGVCVPSQFGLRAIQYSWIYLNSIAGISLTFLYHYYNSISFTFSLLKIILMNEHLRNAMQLKMLRQLASSGHRISIKIGSDELNPDC